MKAFQISACIGGYGYLKLKSNFLNSHFCWLHWFYFSLSAQTRRTMSDFHNCLIFSYVAKFIIELQQIKVESHSDRSITFKAKVKVQIPVVILSVNYKSTFIKLV